MVCKPLNFILFFLITKINWDQVERTTRAGQNLTISIVLKADYTEMIALMNKMLTTDGSTVDIPCMLDVIDLFWSFLGLAHWGIFILVAQSWESSQCVPPWDKKNVSYHTLVVGIHICGIFTLSPLFSVVQIKNPFS